MLGTLYTILKDILAWISRRKHSRDPEAILQRRQKWKEDFEAHIPAVGKFGNRGEAVIRDVRRMDSYPSLSDHEKGISAWFKVELKGLYHRGFEVLLRVERIAFRGSTKTWVYSSSSDPEAKKVLLVGRIPFEAVKAVEWDGDEYYPVPHIYCEFAKKKQPYEALIFYEFCEGPDHPYFLELVEYQKVRIPTQ